MMTPEELNSIHRKLDQILRLLHQMVPNPGYKQGSDGVWRNIATGESQYNEMQRLTAALAPSQSQNYCNVLAGTSSEQTPASSE